MENVPFTHLVSAQHTTETAALIETGSGVNLDVLKRAPIKKDPAAAIRILGHLGQKVHILNSGLDSLLHVRLGNGSAKPSSADIALKDFGYCGITARKIISDALQLRRRSLRQRQGEPHLFGGLRLGAAGLGC